MLFDDKDSEILTLRGSGLYIFVETMSFNRSDFENSASYLNPLNFCIPKTSVCLGFVEIKAFAAHITLQSGSCLIPSMCIVKLFPMY